MVSKIVLRGGIAAVAVVLLVLYFGVFTPHVTPVAKFIEADIKGLDYLNPTQLKPHQAATLTVNVQNISNQIIQNVTIKVSPKYSQNGQYLSFKPNTSINIPIGVGGTSGPVYIQVTNVNTPTATSTETLIVELYVNNLQQDTRSLDVQLVH